MTSLKTILYFSIFNYPVTKDEIITYSDCCSKDEIEEELNELKENNIIYKINNYYLKTNNPEFIEKRLKGNEMAKKVMPKAMKMANKIAQFPFVRGVSFSGAFSKGYFDENGDVDFFIITAKNRLWIARTSLILYKKIFLLNSKKYFCVNYFISEKDLSVAEKNKFTAMEVATLIPTHGKKIFEEFFLKNEWVNDYFPNVELVGKVNDTKKIEPSLFKKSSEWFLNSRVGNLFEHFFHKLTLKKWKFKFKSIPEEEFNIAMKSTEDVSKHHPNNYQKKVIESLNTIYFQVKKNHQIVLEPEHA